MIYYKIKINRSIKQIILNFSKNIISNFNNSKTKFNFLENKILKSTAKFRN